MPGIQGNGKARRARTSSVLQTREINQGSGRLIITNKRRFKPIAIINVKRSDRRIIMGSDAKYGIDFLAEGQGLA